MGTTERDEAVVTPVGRVDVTLQCPYCGTTHAVAPNTLRAVCPKCQRPIPTPGPPGIMQR